MPDQLERLLARARARLTRLEPHEAREATQMGAILVDIRPEFQRRQDGEIPGAIVVERNHRGTLTPPRLALDAHERQPLH